MPDYNQPHLSQFNLHLDGSQVPQRVIDDMIDCTVENSVHLPDMCTLRFNDTEFEWIDADTFREGVKVQVFGGGEGDGRLESLFQGEIVGVELDLAAHHARTLIVRCFDQSHRLHRGRHARSFVQMTDSDIVKRICGEAGFQVEVDETSQVHDWVFQNNQTNWEFCCERARRNGFRLFVRGASTLHFKRVTDDGDDTVELEWGQSLRSFRPRTSVSQQVDEVLVRGWDPKRKATIIGRCERPNGVPKIGESSTGAELASESFGAARMVVVDRPVHSQGEADALARSICDDIGGEFVEADGLCYGVPRLKPGMSVRVNNIGRRFSGQYYVTSTTHTYTPAEGGYSTLFAVNGKRASTLLSILEAGGAGNRAPLGGNIVVGIVTDNKDPDDLGRVKVKYPWLTEDHTSFWARQSSPMAGSGRGFYFLPEIGDEVLIAFEHGDIRRPYVLGMLWNGQDKPVEGNSRAVKGGKVERRSLRTRIGHTLLLEDTGGKGEMSLTTCAGHKIRIRDDEDLILVEDKTGMNKITIKSSDNSISAECFGNFSVNAKGKVLIKGMQGVAVETPMQVSVNGMMGVGVESLAQVKVNGMAGVDVGSMASLSLHAVGPTSLSSSATTTVTGALVKIN